MAKKSLSINNYWTHQHKAADLFTWKKVDCKIKASNGDVYFELNNVEAPFNWSQLAIEITASRYLRKKGIPKTKTNKMGSESSIKNLVERIVNAIAKSGQKQKYFKNSDEARRFGEELKYILWSQRAAFNSPVWFNVGLAEAYGLKSPSHHWAYDFQNKKIKAVTDAYLRPQASACFIQSLDDSLESIFELAKTEAKLFKYGSGSGTNFSKLRSRFEELESGGKSSGLISFLEVLDKGAGAIKSGGTTRRAAKMVIVDVDHPEILDFINWKKNEEEKAKILIAAGYSSSFEGSAYKTVSGQNANNSVRVTDKFMQAVEQNKNWILKTQDRKKFSELPAQTIWKSIVDSAWSCAEPGLQFHDTINKWNTCANTDAIRSSNPCSEFMFLDDTACNLASINLVHFIKSNGEFDIEGFLHTAKMIFIAQDILVDYASYPTQKIAERSHEFRPLGLGFANLGALLMRMGLPYDSPAGRAWAANLAALMTGQAFATSAELSEVKGAFAGFKKNQKPMLNVLRKHFSSLKKIKVDSMTEENLNRVNATAETIWKVVLKKAPKGLRNSQVSVIAPTGTIGLVMDCDTTGIEPDFSLVKYKKLVGGGEVKIVNQSVFSVLQKWGYPENDIQLILKHILENGDVIKCKTLKKEHQKVFQCASGEDALTPESHLNMMSAVQPFVSGAISKTVNLPSSATQDDVNKTYFQAWKLGLKSVALYRDGSKGSQPLTQKQTATGAINMLCPECKTETELHSGCYRCPNCGFTAGCA